MKNKSRFKFLTCVLVICIAALVFSSCAPEAPEAPEADKAIQLRFANYFTPTSLQGQLYQEFCNEIEKRSNGRVEITYYPGGTLFGGSETVDGVKNGIADIGYTNSGYYSGRFPVSEAITVMNGFPSGYVVAHVAHDFYQEFKPEEWNDFKVLLAAGHSPMVIFSTKPVYTLEDFAGTKSRVRGKQADQAKLLGAFPVSIPVGDSFDALSKGVIDSTTTSLEAAKTWRIAEVCPYCTLTWQVFSPPIYYLMMNVGVWNNLPDDIKQIFEEVSAEFVEKSALTGNEVDFIGAEYAKKMGVTFIDLTDEQVTKWREKVAPVTEEYIQSMIEKGYAENEVRGWIIYINERIAYWLDQQAQRGIKSPMGPPEIKM